mmetsp:Transcript_86364/g.249431  ORF Transcript_86364/g.249431 Transcript_86364/m.249431 type:complete len:212 (+) Transcript_86364:98-733(+)
MARSGAGRGKRRFRAIGAAAALASIAVALQGCGEETKSATCGGKCRVSISCGRKHSLLQVEGCGANWRVWRQVSDPSWNCKQSLANAVNGDLCFAARGKEEGALVVASLLSVVSNEAHHSVADTPGVLKASTESQDQQQSFQQDALSQEWRTLARMTRFERIAEASELVQTDDEMPAEPLELGQDHEPAAASFAEELAETWGGPDESPERN